MHWKTGVLTVSDACSRGERDDASGVALAEGLIDAGFEVVDKVVVPDEAERITSALLEWCAHCSLIVTTGGTGFAPRDVTPEATLQVIERATHGLPELLRAAGCRANPRAALSRGVAGIRGKTLIINLPGSPKAVREGLDVLIPLLPHALALLAEQPVDH